MAREIPLTQGKVALVDDEDYEWLNQCDWLHTPSGSRSDAMRWSKEAGERVALYMHREIMAAPATVDVDHVDRDGLNNRRRNLRLATRSQNLRNSKKRNGCSSRYKGVSFSRYRGKWEAYIHVDGRKLNLGLFIEEAAAAHAYNEAAEIHFGEFARLNNV